MAMISLKCPQCNDSLNVEEGRKNYFCPYCGTKVEYKLDSAPAGESAEQCFERWVSCLCDDGNVNEEVSAHFLETYAGNPLAQVVSMYTAKTRFVPPASRIRKETVLVKEHTANGWIFEHEFPNENEQPYYNPEKKYYNYYNRQLLEFVILINHSITDGEAKSRLLAFCQEKLDAISENDNAVDEYNKLYQEIYLRATEKYIEYAKQCEEKEKAQEAPAHKKQKRSRARLLVLGIPALIFVVCLIGFSHKKR